MTIPRAYDINQIGAAVNGYLTSKLSLDAVSEKFRMNRGILRHWIIQFGYKPRKNADWKYNQSNVDECCDLYLKGSRTKELAKKYNVDRRTIMDWLIRQGITPKKFNETLGVTPEMKQRARDLYINDNLNCSDIEKIIGVSSRSIFDWIKDVKRSQSEIAAIKIAKKGSINSRGKKGKVQTKFGKIYFDSAYERDRLIQLNSVEEITSIQRCKDRLKYQGSSNYVPDFFIEYKDGRMVVEEVKPFSMIEKGKNPLKFKHAREFYSDKNIVFRIATEVDIYGSEKGRPNYKKEKRNERRH